MTPANVRIVITYDPVRRMWAATSDDPHQGSVGGSAGVILAQVRRWIVT